MMALFMVLWIMGSVTEEERKEIVSTLNSESIFDGMSINPITQKNSGGEVTRFWKVSVAVMKIPKAAARAQTTVVSRATNQSNPWLTSSIKRNR